MMKKEKEQAKDTLLSILTESAATYPDKKAVVLEGRMEYTYSELSELSGKIATMLYGMGVEKNDKVAIISENHPHWSASYFGILRTGAINVPVLPDFQYTEMYSILEHSEACVAFISAKQSKKFTGGFPETMKYIVVLENFEQFTVSDFDSDRISDVASDGLNVSPDTPPHALHFPEPSPEDIASIIYTSGTTGRSKGVVLTHDNLKFNAVQAGTIHKVESSDVFLSILPLAHTYECTIGMLVPLMNGATIYYIDRAPTASYLGPLLQKLRPTTMLTVPLIIEKIYRSRIKPNIQKQPITRLLASFGPTRKILHRAAGKKLMAFFGDRLRFFGVGGAALSPEVEKFLIEAKFPYAIGYGLTETSPLLAGFGPKDQVFHSVGRVLEGVDIRIDRPDPKSGEGEIVAKGRNIMKGYYQNPEQTAEVFTDDGYFKTGDLGLFDRNGILFIKGRLKNMILGSNGENIYPEEIEAVINTMEYVSESLVFQHKGKLTALVYMNLDQVEEKFQHLLSNANDTREELYKKAQELLDEVKASVNQHLSINSRLQAVVLQMDPFEKTPTQKIKRFLYQKH
jgi:long-chain acyl-CoA synthetase